MQPTFAQMFEVPLEKKIEKSLIVIEGEVIKSTPYFGRVGEIYTTHRVKVYKTLKGNEPQTNFVKVVTRGGRIDELRETWTHQLTLNVGEHGIFFLNHSSYPIMENELDTLTSYEVYSSQQGFLKYDRVNGKNIAFEPFNTFADIDPLIARIKGIPFQSKEIDAENCLIYTFVPSISDEQTLLSINIMARILIGSKELFKSSIAIEYDTTLWGSNLISNEEIIVSDGEISSSTSYTLNAIDLEPNILKITVEATGDNNDLYSLTPQNSNLATISIPIESLPNELDFDFNYELIEQENEYFDPPTEMGKPFNCVQLESEGSDVDPKISTFTPKVVAAGVRDLSLNTPPIPGKITIYGSGFGTLGIDFDTIDLGNAYRVEFKHADVGPTGNWVSPGVRNDYVFWTDDSIQVYVPSIGEFRNNGTIEPDNYCGTGTIRVVSGRTFLGFLRSDESEDELTVRYSVRNGTTNDAMNPPLESIRGKIMNFFDGGIPFFYNQNFPVIARQDAEWAMSEWRCKTGVNLNIQEQSNIPASAMPFACEIEWSDLPAGVNTSTGAFVSFGSAATPCFSVADTSAIHSRHNFKTLTVNKNQNWHMGPDSITLTNNQHDLRSALLHEFGHTHYIQHSLNERELMFFNPELFSKYFRNITPDACLAGIHVSNFSAGIAPTINCGGSPNMQSITPPNCQLIFTTDTRDIKELIGAKVFPSPATDELTVKLENNFGQNGKISVINLHGQVIYSTKTPTSTNSKTFDISGINSGIYYLFIEIAPNQSYSTKFIKI